MSPLHRRITGLIVAGLLTACSSTMPQSAAVPPDTQPTAAAERPSATPTAEPVPSEGPVTASMAKLEIDGERYATLGDPNAPITVVEYSDYG
jgi:protein-disulfide isomerase